MSTSTGNRRNLIAWVRLDGNGNIIPGSCQYRPRGTSPKIGYWRQLQDDYTSCNGHAPSIITFTNTTSATTITAISTADGSIKWAGTAIANNGQISFIIPFGYDQTFLVTVGSYSGRTLTTSKVQGSGTITPSGGTSLTGLTTSITTSAVPNSQYLAVLS